MLMSLWNIFAFKLVCKYKWNKLTCKWVKKVIKKVAFETDFT